MRSLSIVTVSLAALLYAGLTFPGSGLATLTGSRGASGDLLFLTGMLLDGDRDGNSRWPAKDPDDGDPCVRADVTLACDPTIDRPPAEEFAIGRNAILFTWVAPPTARLPTATPGIPLYFATNRPANSIRAMFHDADGLSDYAGKYAIDAGFLPRLARAGYRTLCAGDDGGRGYFKAGSVLRLDAGCQVVQPLPSRGAPSGGVPSEAQPPAGNPEPAGMNRTIHAALRLLERYGEAHANFLWIHHVSMEAETPLSAELLQRLQRKGETIVIQLFPDDVFGRAFLFTRMAAKASAVPYPLPGPLLAYAFGLGSAPPSPSHARVAVLYDQAFESSWWPRAARRLGRDYPLMPVSTLRIDEHGRPLVFDALTGSLTPRPPRSPQSPRL